MSKNKKKSYVDCNASASVNDNFGIVYESMCKSKAFLKLSNKEKLFYFFCRVQSQSENGRRTLYAYNKAENTNYDKDHYFVFPATHLVEYGITKQIAPRYFKSLIDAGFIKVIENNQFRHRPNIYAFSSEWKNSS